MFIALGKPGSPDFVLEGDIRACFDTLSIDWLVNHLPTDRRTLSKWLKAGYIEKGAFFETTAGTPQGGIISPVAARWRWTAWNACFGRSSGQTAWPNAAPRSI